MRILVLDDDEVRHEAFARALKGDVTHVWTHDDACRALEINEAFDLVYLDHDLNDHGKNSVAPGMYGNVELTGFDVARFIARYLALHKHPAEVIVHSWNPAGAFRMVAELREAGIKVSYRPFHGDGGVLLEEDPLEAPATTTGGEEGG